MYAKDLRAWDRVCGHGKGWLRVLNVEKNRYTSFVKITFQVLSTGEVYEEMYLGSKTFDVVR